MKEGDIVYRRFYVPTQSKSKRSWWTLSQQHNNRRETRRNNNQPCNKISLYLKRDKRNVFFLNTKTLSPVFFSLLLLSVGTAHNALFYKVSMEAREKRCYVGWFPANSIHTRQLFLRTDKVLQSRALSLLWLLSSLVFPLLRSAASFFFTTRWEENKKKSPFLVGLLLLSLSNCLFISLSAAPRWLRGRMTKAEAATSIDRWTR